MNDAWILFEWWSSSVLLWWISWFPEGSSGALSDFTFWIRTLVNGVSSTMWLFVVISYSDNAITRLPRSSWLSWYTRYKLVLTSASLKTSNCFVPGILFWPLSAQVYLRQVEFFCGNLREQWNASIHIFSSSKFLSGWHCAYANLIQNISVIFNCEAELIHCMQAHDMLSAFSDTFKWKLNCSFALIPLKKKTL